MLRNATDAVELLLAAALEVAAALLPLALALVDLVHTLARWKPSHAPAVPPLAAITDPALVAAVAAITDAPPAAHPGRHG